MNLLGLIAILLLIQVTLYFWWKLMKAPMDVFWIFSGMYGLAAVVLVRTAV